MWRPSLVHSSTLKKLRRSATRGSWSTRGRSRWPEWAACSTREPERLAFSLEARPEDRGVPGLFEAEPHVGGAPIFYVQVELANIRKKESMIAVSYMSCRRGSTT